MAAALQQGPKPGARGEEGLGNSAILAKQKLQLPVQPTRATPTVKDDPVASRAASAVKGDRVSKEIVEAWKAALEVSELQVAQFVPWDSVIRVGEAILAGATSSMRIADMENMEKEDVRGVLQSPIAMAWISRQIYAHFQHRAGIVDSALYHKAVTGDIAAMKLFYERMGKMQNERTLNVRVSGGLDVSTLSDDDLQRLVRDKQRLLPAEFRILEEGTGTALRGDGGAGAAAGGGAPTVLQPPTEGPPKAEGVPGK